MAVFLPPLHPDELLYSLLARVHWLTCSKSPKQSLDDLFASRRVRAGVAMQANLARLCWHLPAKRKLTPEVLTKSATLFPYLTAFHPPAVQKWALSLLTKGNAGAVHVRLGLVAGSVRSSSFLRYCPICRDEMLTELKELYWMRSHQLPGVLICPRHEVPLLSSTVAPAAVNQHEFIAADVKNCPSSHRESERQWSQSAINLLADIAKKSAEILVNPPVPRSLQQWGDFYHSELVERGFGKGKSSLNQESLQEAFVSHFEPIISLLPSADPNLWLPAITRKHRKSFSPLRHILLQLLLDVTPRRESVYFSSCDLLPCRNPLATHCGQPAMTKSGSHKQGGKTIEVFRCTCGYAFSQSMEPGSRIRILDLGPPFEARLRGLVAAETSLRKTARALSVDTNTVRRYASRLGLSTKWKGLTVVPKSPTHDRDRMRAEWSTGHAAAPELTRKQLRLKMPAVYMWLYRHDWDWLKSRMPLPLSTSAGQPRKNWQEIDAMLATELKDGAIHLRARIPPVAVTRAALERWIGKPNWFESRLQKLPLCVAALNELTESIEAIQCRRIAWAADELRLTETSTIAWRVRRLAGLRDYCASAVEAALIATERNAEWSSNS